MKLVKDLQIGDECIIKVNNKDCQVIVKEIKENRVLVSKPFGYQVFGISFMNPNYSDLFNRVQDI